MPLATPSLRLTSRNPATLLALVALCGALLSAAAPAQEGLGDAEVRRLDRMLRRSQALWPEALPELRALFLRKPAATLHHLVEQLEVDQQVPGLRLESQIYTVCGNALSLLEDLTEVRVDHQGRDWIGFSTHDHRGTEPDRQGVHNPWRCWLEVRESVPPEEWFWGLSAGELRSVQVLLHTRESAWTPSQLEAVRSLGRRAYPLLLDLLLEEDHACDDRRLCEQSLRILEELSGRRFGPLARHELLTLDPADPARSERLALERNRASMQLVHSRCLAALLLDR